MEIVIDLIHYKCATFENDLIGFFEAFKRILCVEFLMIGFSSDILHFLGKS